MFSRKQLDKEAARVARGEPPLDLSTLTPEQRAERLLTRFAWDGDEIVWETNPDDIPDEYKDPAAFEKSKPEAR